MSMIRTFLAATAVGTLCFALGLKAGRELGWKQGWDEANQLNRIEKQMERVNALQEQSEIELQKLEARRR